MTKAGIGFIAGGVVVYALGGQTQIGWLYLLDAMVWSVVIFSAFFPWWSLRSLRVERWVLLPFSPNWQELIPTEAGTVEVKLVVRNQGRLARHLIKVVEDCPLEEPSKRSQIFFLPTVKGKSEMAFSYTATCYRRGRYTSAGAVLETAAPLGLFVRRCHYNLPLKVTVYPTHYEMRTMLLGSGAWSDQGKMVKSGAAAEFYSSREYQYGDPLKYIHWRNTARLGQFVVKEFEAANQGSVAVVFETKRDWGWEKETTVEYSIRIAASLARRCGDSGQAITILAGPNPLPRAGWLEAMDYLAGLSLGSPTSLEELAATAEKGQALLVIVPAGEPGLIPSLLRLATRGGGLVVVLLEGFASGEKPQEFVFRLNESNLALVRCFKGKLKAAIEALGHSRLWAG